MAFRIGDRVEVASKQEGFVGSYYSAKIVAELDDGGYVVKYDTLLKADESGPLVETAQADELRPVPVKIPTSRFSLNDYVDAYDNEGWWVGRVVGKVGFGYSVYFDTTGDLIDYPSERLRIHLEWSHDAWWFVHRSSSSLSQHVDAMGQTHSIAV